MKSWCLLGGFFLAMMSSVGSASDRVDAWIQIQEPLSITYLRANISPPDTARGAIVASPSKSEPDYFYHWTRDASLVTQQLVKLLSLAKVKSERDAIENIVLDTLRFNGQLQALSSTAGLGEPKFEVDGSVFKGPWGRPQNDGPALRAIAYLDLADFWLSQGNENEVRDRLYQPELPAHSIIKSDLEYVSHHWRDTDFDPWEEIRGHHFFTRMVQRKALLLGAKLALRLGDDGAAHWYDAQAALLSAELERHWDPSLGVIVPTRDRDGGIDYKTSQLDSSVVLGSLYGNREDGFFSIDDPRVLSTVTALENAFRNLYAINQSAAIPGIAMGRYPEDRYTGTEIHGQGNPWVLITAAFAEWYYRLASIYEKRGQITIVPSSLAFFRSVDPKVRHLALGKLTPDSPLFALVLRGLKAKGDSFLERLRYHQQPNGHFAEQINRNSGYLQGAVDLTWNYAALLSAIEAKRSLK